jgi:hypothetical protein
MIRRAPILVGLALLLLPSSGYAGFPTPRIDQKTMLTIAGAGYVGTDFIEGFMKSNLPK